MDLAIMEGTGAEACAAALDDAGPGLGMPFEAHLNPMELQLAHKLVGDLKPCDPQEEMHAWHLAVSHILAAQRFGKSRQEGLSERAGQIEVGLAVRLMALADRKSTSLDRHRAFRLKAADEAEQRAAVRAYQEAEAAKRAAEDAKQAEWAAWRRKCSDQRVPDDEREEQEAQEDRGEQAATEDHAAPEGPEGPEANGNAGETAAPVLSEAEAAAQLAWEQAIEAARPHPREEEADDGEEADPAPARGLGSASGPGPGPEAGQAPLNRRQRRALARRAKKQALHAGRGTS